MDTATKYKPFGVDLDPKGELNETVLPDGDIEGSIKGEKVSYDRIIDELEARANRVHDGHSPVKGELSFSGIGESKLGNAPHSNQCSCLACR